MKQKMILAACICVALVASGCGGGGFGAGGNENERLSATQAQIHFQAQPFRSAQEAEGQCEAAAYKERKRCVDFFYTVATTGSLSPSGLTPNLLRCVVVWEAERKSCKSSVGINRSGWPLFSRIEYSATQFVDGIAYPLLHDAPPPE